LDCFDTTPVEEMPYAASNIEVWKMYSNKLDDFGGMRLINFFL
jgi:hypothetical protein